MIFFKFAFALYFAAIALAAPAPQRAGGVIGDVGMSFLHPWPIQYKPN